IVRIRYSGKMYGWQRRRTPTERETNYYNSLLTDGDTAKEIRLFDLGALFLQRARERRALVRKERLALEGKTGLSRFLAQTAASTIRRRGESPSTASICATSRRPTCAATSV